MSTVFDEQPDLGEPDLPSMDLEDRHALRRVAGLSTELQDISEVEYRALRLELQQAAAGLADLDVARWRPEAADALMNLHHRPALAPPPGTPPRCAELAARSLQALAIVDLALEDDGGALSAAQAAQRRETLQPLGTAARRGLVAACSPEVWPE